MAFHQLSFNCPQCPPGARPLFLYLCLCSQHSKRHCLQVVFLDPRASAIVQQRPDLVPLRSSHRSHAQFVATLATLRLHACRHAYAILGPAARMGQDNSGDHTSATIGDDDNDDAHVSDPRQLSNIVVARPCCCNLITDVVCIRGSKLSSCKREEEARVQHISFVAPVPHATCRLSTLFHVQ